jgi:hypothetical protein
MANEVILPIPNFNISADDNSLYDVGGDDHFLTSAYCKKDKIQWIYLRDIVRGLSYAEKIGCPCCRGNLIIGNSDASFISSSNILEVVGWLQIKRRILHLAITESYIGELKENLLLHLQEHSFAASIKGGKLLAAEYISPAHRTRRRADKLLQTVLVQNFSLSRRRKKLLKNLSTTLEEDLKSPLRRPENLKNQLSADEFEKLRQRQPSDSLMTKNFDVDSNDLERCFSKLLLDIRERKKQKKEDTKRLK